MSLGSTWGCEKEDLEFRNSGLHTVHSVKDGMARVSLLPGDSFWPTLVSFIALTIQCTLLGTLIIYNHQTKTLKSLSLVTYGDSETQTTGQ